VGVVSLALGGAACTGLIGDGEDPQGGPSAQTLGEIGVSGLRRLTAVEYDATIFDLLGVVVQSETALPEDLRSPFDNDYTKQQASEALISAADVLAGDIAAQVVADADLRARAVPCEPSGPTDDACYREFLATFGRRAFRRPLSQVELDHFATVLFPHAAEENDFWVAVHSGLRAFLQHPAFLYRVEVGTPVEGQPGVFRLSDFELGTRMSYLLWGTTPPDWLLDGTEQGALATPEGVRAAVTQLLDDDRAKERIARFHGMWLGYERLPHAAELADAMQLETGKLLERVVFEERGPWVDLLRSTETYLNDTLAAHYGLPAPSGGEGWVSYGDSGRQGLLSQGSFLSAVAKFDDTSPTQRGLLIRTRLFCQNISPPPPDLMVNTDMPPEGPDPNACKEQRYSMWQTDGCKLCHAKMDPVGFGLENYDTAGRYREFEPDRPDCPIDGVGMLEGVGEFQGPAELSSLMIEAGGVDECVATMVLRFAAGRYQLGAEDQALVDRLVPIAQRDGALAFYDLLVELVGSEAFRHRREEVAP
jgi:hypothetical protein